MSIISPQIFNQKKKIYKRLFIFGCSFSVYHWPTWANILKLEMPNAEYYNFAKSGGGNFFIYAQIIAANQKYNFAENDCIAVLWSTHGREDRYVNNYWKTPGNIWSQKEYSDEFIRKNACIKGYLVRDLAIFKGAKIVLDSLPCDAIDMYSVPVDYDKRYLTDENDSSFDELLALYSDIVSDMNDTLYSSQADGGGGWINGHRYYWPGLSDNQPSKWFNDYHPNPNGYLKFLLNKGFDISDETQSFINDRVMPELMQITHRDLIVEWAMKLYKEIHPNYEYKEFGVPLELDKNKSRLP